MKKTIVVAGATGNLGGQIGEALLGKGAHVRALVRAGGDVAKTKRLADAGMEVHAVDMRDERQVAAACQGAACVVSALAGLRDVVVDVQKTLLDAAVLAGVPRFIPSDYSLDFTKFTHGENRNLDWRREFHTHLDKAPVAATSIFNGAFADLLTGQMPLILSKPGLVLYWGEADHRMGFTSVADTAAFTARAALDDTTPRYLHVAGDRLSPREVRQVAGEVTGRRFRLLRAGGPGLLDVFIKIARKIAPAPDELYPAWQGMQYMRNMIDKRGTPDAADNNRYPDMEWTSVRHVLAAHHNSQKTT